MPYKDDETRKAKQREYSKNWYERNRKKHQAGVAKNKRDARTKWIEYKSAQSCTKCGAQHPAIIDFHHVIRENKQSVHRLAAAGAYKKAKRESEEKCIPLCANCHRILHFEEIELEKLEREARRVKKAKKKKGAEAP